MRRPIITSCFAAGFFLSGLFGPGLPAFAQDKCALHETIIESLALSHRLLTQPDNRAAAQQFDRVSASLQISDLVASGVDGLPTAQRDALFSYIVSVRDAAMQGGQDRLSRLRAIQSDRIKPELFAGLSTLENGWACRPETTDAETQTSSRQMAQTFNRGSSGVAGATPGNPARALPSNAARTGPSKATSGGTYFGRDALVDGSVMLAYLLLLGIILLIAFFAIQRRLRRERIRESRRLLDQPVTIFIEGTAHKLRLIDISMNGAKLRHSGEIDREVELGLQLDGTWYSGQIRWFNDNFAGIKFRRPLNIETLESALGASGIVQAS